MKNQNQRSNIADITKMENCKMMVKTELLILYLSYWGTVPFDKLWGEFTGVTNTQF